MKTTNQTFVEFAHEKKKKKTVLFDKWCVVSKVENYMQLKELILLEDFKRGLLDGVVVYLNEQKVFLRQLCWLMFVLTHKNLDPSAPCSELNQSKRNRSTIRTGNKHSNRTTSEPAGVRACFYCHRTDCLIAKCPMLEKKKNLPTRHQSLL